MPFPSRAADSSVMSSTSISLAKVLHFKIPEVWLRFLAAIAGLILAFAAALFSTISRESGNLWATLILASVALILALLVGLTTVPYLARRVAVSRIREAFDYEVTTIGIFYVVGVLLIGIAALNTGNNLLYIVVAALLGGILISGVASAVVLRDLELDVHVPDHVFAGRVAAGKVVLRNPRRWLPSFSVNVTSLAKSQSTGRWQWTRATFSFPPGRSSEKQWIKLPDWKLGSRPAIKTLPAVFEGNAYFPYLPAGSVFRSDLKLDFRQRGQYQQEEFGLATRFPFAFFTKTRRVPLRREIIVYPAVEPTDEFLEILPLITGEFETFSRGRGNDLYRIREYTPEDSVRHVDWKATAKSGSLKVREFSREDERKLRIIFDNPERNALSDGEYEKAVALAASVGWHFAGQNGEMSFVAQGYEGGNDIYHFLRYLALVGPGSSPSLIDRLHPTEAYNIIFTARPHGSVPTGLWACSYLVFIGKTR